MHRPLADCDPPFVTIEAEEAQVLIRITPSGADHYRHHRLEYADLYPWVRAAPPATSEGGA